jgi:hypothetical protein
MRQSVYQNCVSNRITARSLAAPRTRMPDISPPPPTRINTHPRTTGAAFLYSICLQDAVLTAFLCRE